MCESTQLRVTQKIFENDKACLNLNTAQEGVPSSKLVECPHSPFGSSLFISPIVDSFHPDNKPEKIILSKYFNGPVKLYFFSDRSPSDAEEEFYLRSAAERSRLGSLELWSNGDSLRTWKAREWGVVLLIWGNRHDPYNNDDKFELAFGPEVKPLFDFDRSLSERTREFLTEDIYVVKKTPSLEGPYIDRPTVILLPAKAAYSAPETHFLAARELCDK